MIFNVSLAALLAGFFLLACGDSSEPNGEAEVEGCEHRTEGPFRQVSASTSAGDAPLVELEHADTEVTLAPVTGGNGGFVRFSSAEPADAVLFVSEDVPLTLRDDQDQVVAAEETVAQIEECPELLAAYYVFELEVGAYTLEVGATTAQSFHVVLAPLEADGHAR